MEVRQKLAARLFRLSDMPLAERIRLITLIYIEEGFEAAKEATRLANIPIAAAERRGRWALLEDDIEQVEERIEVGEEPLEDVDDSLEEVEEEYVGKSLLKRITPWS